MGLDNNDVGLVEIASFLKRRGAIAVYAVCVCVAVALAYWWAAVPQYSSTALVLLDQKSARFNDLAQSSTDPTSDAANLESQIAILNSDRLAKEVIGLTDLVNDKGFFPGPSFLQSKLQSILPQLHRATGEVGAELKLQTAIDAFHRSLAVKRLGVSYVLSVEFTHPNPERAAYIVNELVKEYVRELDLVKAESSRKAANWLDNQLNLLQLNVRNAEMQLEAFKTSKYFPLANTPPTSDDPKTINEESLKSKQRVTELEVAANRNKTIYDTFLQRYSETLQSVYPGDKAVIISEGQVPYKKSAPKLTLYLAMAAPAGLVLGLVLAYLIDALDNKIMTTDALETVTGMSCLGIIPRMKQDARFAVATDPFSRFAETIRAVKLAIDLKRVNYPIKTIGITSAVPSEGKSTVSSNLATTIALAGSSVIVIDADLRAQGFTRAVAPTAERGLLEVLVGTHGYEDCIQTSSHGFDILPAVVLSPIANSNELISGEKMKALLRVLRESYDYVILDLPPLLAVVDTRSVGSIVDAFLFVASWTIRKDVVARALLRSQIGSSRFLGSVFNSVDLAKYKKLDSLPDDHYYYYGYGSAGEPAKGKAGGPKRIRA